MALGVLPGVTPQEEGQGLVEYALILVLVAVVVIAILLLLGPIIGNTFSAIVMGVGAGFAREYFDTTLKTAADVRRYGQLDVLAVVPERG